MARIFKFPVRPRVKHQQATSAPPQAEPANLWRDIWTFPPFHIVLLLVTFFIIACWPILRWLLAFDLIYQLLCMSFLSGWSSFAAFLHLLFLGALAIVFLVLIPRNRK